MVSKIFKNRWVAIALYFVIAVIGRALAIHFRPVPTAVDFTYMLWGWAEGVGPCLGALAVVLLLKRRFVCTITGASILKSALSVIIPFGICFCLHQQLSYLLLGFILYSFLEEVGWRGYLQGELEDKSPFSQACIIGLLWFVWHLKFSFSLNALIFLALLIFGSWGIGRVARDTHSLVLCACFHTLYNFSSHGWFTFNATVICIYVLVIASWFLIWYTPWHRLFAKR